MTSIRWKKCNSCKAAKKKHESIILFEFELLIGPICAWKFDLQYKYLHPSATPAPSICRGTCSWAVWLEREIFAITYFTTGVYNWTAERLMLLLNCSTSPRGVLGDWPDLFPKPTRFRDDNSTRKLFGRRPAHEATLPNISIQSK